MKNKSSYNIRNLQEVTGRILLEKGTAPYTLKGKRLDSVCFCSLTGTSMNPTLSESDLLAIEPYDNQPVRIGDVIFFLSPQGEKPAVHRVVRISPEGVRTRGDNNTRMDPWIIHPEDIFGRVVRAARGEKQRSVYGGIAGQLWSLSVRAFKMLEKSLSFFYHRLAQSSLFRYLVPLQKRMRIIALTSATGKEFKLLLGRWVVGRYKPEMISWHIRRPFRLFVDERSLPR
jgi:signal peptidase